MDGSEIYSERLDAMEVIFLEREWQIHFSSRRWTIQTSSGGDQELRTSTLIRGSPNSRRRVEGIFLENQKGLFLPRPQDSLPDAGEATNDFWSTSGNFTYRHHVEPRVKLYSPRGESFSIPLKYIDVSRTTQTNLNVMQEKPHRGLLECRWIKRFV